KPAVGQVRRDECVKVVVRQRPDERHKLSFLKHHVAIRIADDLLDNSVAPVVAGVDDPEGGDSVVEKLDLVIGVALLFGKEALAVGDDQTEITRAGTVDPGIVNLVEDAVSEGKPYLAPRAERGSDATL